MRPQSGSPAKPPARFPQAKTSRTRRASTPSRRLRERLLLDFGWRFHFGDASDPDKDFGFGSGRSGNFQKTGNFLAAGSLAFDDSDWKPVDLPHDWAIELPFKNDPALSAKVSIRSAAIIPRPASAGTGASSSFDAADDGKRITLEFDGAYRETMVVFNGFYIGRHSGGYDPFQFRRH